MPFALKFKLFENVLQPERGSQEKGFKKPQSAIDTHPL